MPLDFNTFKKNYQAVQPKRKGNKSLPYWELKTKKSLELQFLPNVCGATQAFWAISRTFPAYFVDPEDSSKEVVVYLPSPKMYSGGNYCPFGARTSTLFDNAKEMTNSGDTTSGEALRAIASKHWTKPKFLLQCLVNSGLDLITDPDPSNPVKLIGLTKQASFVVTDQMFGNEDEEGFDFNPSGEFTPEDIALYVEGKVDIDDPMFRCRPFRLKNVKKGGKSNHNNWEHSSFMDETRYTEEQLDAIIEHGTRDWDEILPTEPTAEQLEVMDEIQELSIKIAMGDDVDDTWNPEWEALTGLKPFNVDGKPDAKEAAKASKKTVRKAVTGSEDGVAAVRSNAVVDKLKAKGRSVKSETSDGAKSGAASRIKQRLAEKAAAKAAAK